MNLLLLITHTNDWHFLTAGDTTLERLFRLWMVIMLCTAFVCFLVGELSHNYSQTDKVWSLMPMVYSWSTLLAFPSSPRIWLMTLLVTVWGIRLSYNFYRKGGYNVLPWKGEEDYRWNVVRQFPLLRKGIRITLFNLLFISFYQHLLILLFSTPLLLAARYATVPLSKQDYLAAIFMVVFILIESIADNQLHIFQIRKRHKVPLDRRFVSSLQKGFLTEGLWRYVRHPNFIGEQAIWVSFYFFGVAASGQLLNWTIVGPFLLILLFMGSSRLTEQISMEKYPDYRNYIQQVPKFIPFVFKSGKQRKR